MNSRKGGETKINRREEITYVDILITQFCKTGIYHGISYTKTIWFAAMQGLLDTHFAILIFLSMKEQGNTILTDFSDRCLVDFAAEVVPAIPPEYTVLSILHC